MESAVRFLTVFALVETAELLTFSNAQSNRLLDGEEDHAGCCEAGESVSDNADGLSAERVVASDIEEADCERSPDTVYEVNRERTDRVIQVQAVEHEDCADDEHTSDSTDNPRGERGYNVCTGSDGDETSKASVKGHGGVRLLGNDPASERCGNDASHSGEVCGHENPASCLRVAVKSRTGIESPPTEPEHEHADRCKRNVVGRDGVNLAANILADTRSENHHASESCPTTHRVDEGRTSEVVETSLANGRKPAAAPCPATHDRIDERNIDKRENQERVELHAFSNSSGNNRSGGFGKHRLEQPVCEQSVMAVVCGGEVCRISPVANAEACESKPARDGVECTRIHQSKTECCINRDADGRHGDVFESDVRCALGTNKTCFDTREAQPHDKHQHGADHDPNVFRHKDCIADGCDLCCCVHLYKSFFKI